MKIKIKIKKNKKNDYPKIAQIYIRLFNYG